MVAIRLHNSKTRRKEAFAPLDPANVRMYVCGPTVYDRAHLGNARPVVVFDVLFRLLRHVYGEEHVTYVRNFTDVDDKINARARQMQQGGDARALNDIIRVLTDETIGWYHQDMDALGALRPTHEPRATEYVGQMIAMIEGLIAKGCAYVAEGHVLFDVRSYPEYGRLSGRSVDDMIAGARVEVAPYKRDAMDFVLWKPSSADEPGWDSPWGRGRPGWHIECSAMSHELLGPSFDIHGGGIDLQFPHHENEVAQSCCAHPEGDFARFWLHNEMVQVEGRKMSKSLGNFFTVRDLLDTQHDGAVIRLLFLQTHYRKSMDWTDSKYSQLRNELFLWELSTLNVDQTEVPGELIDALADDFNTPQALTVLRNLKSEKRFPELLAGMRFLGLPPIRAKNTLTIDEESRARKLNQLGTKLSVLRSQAMQSKDFSAVDDLKAALVAAGIEVRMSKQGVELIPGPDFDPAKLEGIE
ncbi:MAG: cysteine--tRNA ligase [Pararhodobacter sp.]|nr:cysteine--tRNA ligase [Pararhodobacter sp.]